MKTLNYVQKIQGIAQLKLVPTVGDAIENILLMWNRHPLAVRIFSVMCFNLLIAPAVYAYGGDELTRKAAWSLGLLGLVTIGLSIYLFAVIFEPERF